MKYLLLILSLLLISCTKMAYKTYTVPPVISLEKTKYKSIKVVDLKSYRGDGSVVSYIADYGNEFALDSFKNTLQKSLKEKTKLKVIHAPTTREIINLRLAEKDLPKNDADLLVYGVYQESNGTEPYSYDSVGQNSKMLFSQGWFSYRIVDRKTGEVILSDSVSNKRRIHATNDVVYNGKEASEQNASLNRISLASKFSNVFLPTKKGYYAKADEGDNN